MNPTVVTEKIENICAKLIEVQQFNAAADLFLMAEMPEQAIEALIKTHEWTKIRRVFFITNLFFFYKIYIF